MNQEEERESVGKEVAGVSNQANGGVVNVDNESVAKINLEMKAESALSVETEDMISPSMEETYFSYDSSSEQSMREIVVPDITCEVTITTEDEEYVPVSLDIEDTQSFEIQTGKSFDNNLTLTEEETPINTPDDDRDFATAYTVTNEHTGVPYESDNSCSSELTGIEPEEAHLEAVFNMDNLHHKKFHNLSIPELRRKLSFCPICQVQYGNYKVAKTCLARHGKRQCWLCLELLSSTKEDFQRHCKEFHTISSSKDVVGCPFCGKFFDFRQGLNQHIVKIHFSESIADLDSVSTLSPTTLVDIFTGKSKAAASFFHSRVREDSASTHEQSLRKSIFDLNSQTAKYDSCNSPLNFPKSAAVTPESSQEGQAVIFPDNNNPCTAVTCEAGTAESRPRPSVITPSLKNTVQKMSVPPEQSMDRYAEEINKAAVLLPDYDDPHQQLRQPPHYSRLQTEQNVQILENPGFKFPFEPSSLNYSVGRSAPYLPSTVTSQSGKISSNSNPKKCEMPLYSSFSEEGNLQEITPEIYSAIEGSFNSQYERAITRVDSSFTKKVSQENNSANHTASNIDLINKGPGNYYTYTLDPDKRYLNTSTVSTPPKTSSELLGFNDQPMRAADMKATVQIYSAAVAKSSGANDNSFGPASHNPNDWRNIRGFVSPEVERVCSNNIIDPTRFSSKSGTKRKAQPKDKTGELDHHHFKKPAPVHNAFVSPRSSFHSEPTQLNLLNSAPKPVSSSPFVQSSHYSTPVGACKTTLHGGVSESISCGELELTKVNVHRQQSHSHQPRQLHMGFGQMTENVGPFFQKYVKQDKSRDEDVSKLLNSVRPIRPLILSELRGSGAKRFDLSLAWNNEACARHNKSTGNCGNLGPNLFCGASPRSQSQWQAQTPPSPISTAFARPQFPTPRNLVIRKPPNPSFWDNLRARLIAQHAVRQPGNSTFSKCTPISDTHQKETFRYGHREKVENIVIQNPFEEETHPGMSVSACSRNLEVQRMGMEDTGIGWHLQVGRSSHTIMNPVSFTGPMPDHRLPLGAPLRFQQHQHAIHTFSMNRPFPTPLPQPQLILPSGAARMVSHETRGVIPDNSMMPPPPPPPLPMWHPMQQNPASLPYHQRSLYDYHHNRVNQ